MKEIVVALSGGLDSYVLANYLIREGYKIYPVFIKYMKNQPELEYAKRQVKLLHLNTLVTSCEDLKIFDIPLLQQDMNEIPFVPNRNLFMLSLLAIHAGQLGIDEIGMAFVPHYEYNKKNNKVFLQAYSDADINFVSKCKDLLNYISDGKLKLVTPFVDKPKDYVIKLAREYNLRDEDSFSCFGHGNKPCLNCPGCWDRMAQFMIAGYEDNSLFSLKGYNELRTKLIIAGKDAIDNFYFNQGEESNNDKDYKLYKDLYGVNF